MGARALEPALALPGEPDGVDDIESLLPFGDQIGNQLGGILKIGVEGGSRPVPARDPVRL